MRQQDAVPDELEVVGDTSKPSSRRTSQSRPDRTSTPGGTPIPKTVVEKIDPDTPSHGDIPGTEAFNMRQADAVPDVILQSPNAKSSFPDNVLDSSVHPGISVPKTIVTKVDEEPSHGEVPGTEAYDKRAGDAVPDVVETKGDPASKSLYSYRHFQRAIDPVRFTNIFISQVLASQPQAKTVGDKKRQPDRGRWRFWANA